MVNDNNKEKKEMVTTAKELMKLMILKLNEELYGQGSKLRTRALQYLGLLIEKMEIEVEREKMCKKIYDWEYENNMLQNEGEAQGEHTWEFQYEWL
ncbi:MAG TPA: hypothetical protein EYQ78_03715 [Candidatus Poseidoniales archaeon]|jgi:hypothetical protein|nr:hypothetical protein [Candidatus Poseidoniales archaeon]